MQPSPSGIQSLTTCISQSKLIVQAVEESEDDNNGLGARAPVRKRPRRAASEVPEEESRSSRHLPGFIKPFLEPSIIPTVINYYGAKENPWDLQELGRDELLDLCQTLVDEVLPRKGHIVKKSELIYKLVSVLTLQSHVVLYTTDLYLALDPASHLCLALELRTGRYLCSPGGD